MHRQTDQVGAIILAAGTSSRLGRPKQFLYFNGTPLVQLVARTVAASVADTAVVVAGEHVDAIRALMEQTRVTVVHNPDYATGQASSLLAGLAEVRDSADAVVFVLGDQPQLRTSSLDAVISAWRETRAPIVQARYRNGRSHPALFDRSLFAELETISGDAGAAQVVRNHAHETVPVDLDEDVPHDIDTDDDYQRVHDLISAPKA